MSPGYNKVGYRHGDKINTIVFSVFTLTSDQPVVCVSWEDGVLIIMTGNDTYTVPPPYCTHTSCNTVIVLSIHFRPAGTVNN